MSYTKASPQPALRDPAAVGWDFPGLYPNEVALKLDTGQLVAVFVETTWLGDNNAGTSFYVSARYVDATGQTICDVHQQEIVTEFTHTSSPAELLAFGQGPLAVEMVKAILGEPSTTVPVPGATDGSTMPMIPWSPELLANIAIRTAIATTAQTGEVSGLLALL
jgi:hypothetical protein